MASRSPSPNPSRPRTPEANNPLRKSKDNLKTNSASKSLTQRFYEHKENEKKRPSLIPNSKVPKNFMAPTISAASKFTPSPSRKKVLQERNEVVNSVSKSLDFPIKSEFCSIDFEFEAKSENGFVNKDISNSFEAKSENGFVNKDISNSFEAKREDLETKIYKQTSPLPQIAALDADPTLPPYDPKTNYLSPRPQFLHYRPNPRIEHYFSDINDGRKLDDSFSSESSDVDYEKEQEHKSETSDESFHSEVEKIESDELELNSECENATESSNCESKSENFHLSESKSKDKLKKNRFFRRQGLISFLLILLLAFLNVPLSDTPSLSSSPFKPNSYSFVNMTHSIVDESASVSLSYVQDTGMKQEFKESDLELPQQSGIDIGEEIESENLDTESEMHELVNDDAVENEIFNVIYEDIASKEAPNLENELEIEGMESVNSDTESEMHDLVNDDGVENEIFNMIYENIASKEAPNVENELEIEGMESADVKEQVENEIFDSIYENVVKLDTKHEVQNSEIVLENAKEEQVENENTFDSAYTHEVEDSEIAVEYATNAMNLTTVCGLLLAMLAFAAAYLVFKGKGKQNANIQNAKQNVNSGSSEMSYSFNDTAKSNEQRRRRDSTASSSSSFLSYGSYTTFERISAKKGNREEEMVTPVRRSSRIKHLTSP